MSISKSSMREIKQLMNETNVRAFYKHRDEELNFNGLNNKIT